MSSDRQALTRRAFAELRVNDNLACADCGRKNPQWASVTYVTMDSWTDKHLAMMRAGGNANLKAFLTEQQFPANLSIHDKYSSEAMALYRAYVKAKADGQNPAPIPFVGYKPATTHSNTAHSAYATATSSAAGFGTNTVGTNNQYGNLALSTGSGARHAASSVDYTSSPSDTQPQYTGMGSSGAPSSPYTGFGSNGSASASGSGSYGGMGSGSYGGMGSGSYGGMGSSSSSGTSGGDWWSTLLSTAQVVAEKTKEVAVVGTQLAQENLRRTAEALQAGTRDLQLPTTLNSSLSTVNRGLSQGWSKVSTFVNDTIVGSDGYQVPAGGAGSSAGNGEAIRLGQRTGAKYEGFGSDSMGSASSSSYSGGNSYSSAPTGAYSDRPTTASENTGLASPTSAGGDSFGSYQGLDLGSKGVSTITLGQRTGAKYEGFGSDSFSSASPISPASPIQPAKPLSTASPAVAAKPVLPSLPTLPSLPPLPTLPAMPAARAPAPATAAAPATAPQRAVVAQVIPAELLAPAPLTSTGSNKSDPFAALGSLSFDTPATVETASPVPAAAPVAVAQPAAVQTEQKSATTWDNTFDDDFFADLA